VQQGTFTFPLRSVALTQHSTYGGQQSGRAGDSDIIAGQYAGSAAIASISLAAVTRLRATADRCVGLLGFVPIAFGNPEAGYEAGGKREEPDCAEYCDCRERIHEAARYVKFLLKIWTRPSRER
jgi:hypothetical protein